MDEIFSRHENSPTSTETEAEESFAQRLSKQSWSSLDSAGRGKGGAKSELEAKADLKSDEPSKESKPNEAGFSRESRGKGSFVENHWGPRPSDHFRRERDSSGKITIFDGLDKLEPSARRDLSLWHTRLMDQASSKITDKHELNKFQADMHRFEHRAKNEGLNPLEVSKTYEQVNRLFHQKGGRPLNELDRTRIAQQILEKAGRPSSVDQGIFNTCGVSTIEVRTYALSPSSAAKLVADAALTGSFKSQDGTIVTIDPKPRKDNRSYPPADGARSHASLLFQLVGANLIHERNNKKSNPPAHLKYEQFEPDTNGSKSGEGLFDYAEVVAGKASEPKLITNKPELFDDDLAALSNMITGRDEKGIVLAHTGEGRGSDELIGRFDSAEKFQEKLLLLKQQKLLPVSLRVDSDSDPFYTDSDFGKAGGSGGWHQVTIYNFEPANANKPAYVDVDNTWGSKADRFGVKRLTVQELYATTKSSGSPETIKILEQLVQTRRDSGNPDLMKDLDLPRLKLKQNAITKIEYIKAIETAIDEFKAAAPAVDIYSNEELKTKIKQLTLPVFVGDNIVEIKTRASKLRFQFGVDNEDAFEKSMRKNAMEIAKAEKSVSNENEVNIFKNALRELRKAIGLLSEERKTKIAEALKKEHNSTILDANRSDG